MSGCQREKAGKVEVADFLAVKEESDLRVCFALLHLTEGMGWVSCGLVVGRCSQNYPSGFLCPTPPLHPTKTKKNYIMKHSSSRWSFLSSFSLL